MGSTLLYAPEVTIRIQTSPTSRGKGKLVDVSEDISTGSVTRVINGISSAEFTLLNQSRKYDGMFSPMDRVVIYERRIKTVLKFSGYLDYAPLWSALPGSVNLRASCTIKRLANFMWDPTSAAAFTLMNPFIKNSVNQFDGGVAQLAIRLLTNVANWPLDQIHIAQIPQNWFDTVASVADKIIAQAETASMASAAGAGAWLGGSNPSMQGASEVKGIGPGTGKLPDTIGKCSEFGGPNGGAYGRFALTGESGTNPNDGWYCAMRWGYVNPDLTGAPGVNINQAKQWWVNRRILVTNPKSGKSVVVRAADWGPNLYTHRVIDLAPQALRALGGVTNDTMHIAFAPPNAPLGPVSASTAAQDAAAATLISQSVGGSGGASGSSTGWGKPGDTSNLVTASAVGFTFQCHRLAKTNFEGFLRELVSTLGYHPKSVGCYSVRGIEGFPGAISNHAWGAAIDIDPSTNKFYYNASGGPYTLPKPPAIVQLARKWGLYWGGEYQHRKDYMHFEVIGAPSTPAVPGYKPSAAASAPAKWTPPIHTPPGYTITTHFGDTGPHWAHGHSGTDFACPRGTSIYPVGPGKIHQIGIMDKDYGNWVSVDHGANIYTQYAHMTSPCALPVGTDVTQNTVIGNVGTTGNTTGPHVHCEFRRGADTYNAALASGGIDKYVVGGANRSDPPAGTTAASGDLSSSGGSTGSTSGTDFTAIGDSLFNTWQMFNEFQTTDQGTLLGGYRALLNDTPISDTIGQFMGAAMRHYCSAPNGDFIAWFPDYFGHYGQAGKMIINELEISQDGGPPTIGWSDQDLKTHQFVSGSSVMGKGDASSIWQQASTAGVASVEMPELMQALFNITKAEALAMQKDYLSRMGARPFYEAMDQISTHRAEFFFACHNFQQNFAQQYQASVNVTFMPELFPGMLACFPDYGVQAYVVETTDSWDLAGGGFSTSFVGAPWSSIGSGGPSSVANMPKGAAL